MNIRCGSEQTIIKAAKTLSVDITVSFNVTFNGSVIKRSEGE